MGRLTTVLAFARRDDDGAKWAEVQVDPGGGATVTADHVGQAGEDSQPLKGDTAMMVESAGSGRAACVGYLDTTNEGQSAPGEKRFYARDEDGAIACVVWLKSDGTVAISNTNGGAIEMAPSGDVTINGVTIDMDGNIIAPGEVTAKSSTAPVKLSTHKHPTAMGPSGVPTPEP